MDSLSLDSAPFCLLSTTGADQAALLPAAAAARSSACETVTASKPLVVLVPGKFAARFA